MRASPLSTIAVVAFLVLAGCAGLPGSGETESTPDASPSDFPNASAINSTVFDTHTAEMANTSFTLSVVQNRTDRNPAPLDSNYTYMNGTNRILAEPGASQYLGHGVGFSEGVSIYSNGTTEYMRVTENRTTTGPLHPNSPFNESGDQYLWHGWFNKDSGHGYDYGAINATYEREGVELHQGVSVMRYEATDPDALTGSWAGGENASWTYENFSATLLLDEDGVVRYYEYTFEKPPEHMTLLRFSRTYTLSDVGSTDVEKPDWTANATARS